MEHDVKPCDREAHLEHIIDRDRYVVAMALNNIKAAVNCHRWLLEGRGPYQWDDEEYRDEFARWVQEVDGSTEILAKLAWDKTDCTTDVDKVCAAKDAAAEYAKRKPRDRREMLPTDLGLPCPSCSSERATEADLAALLEMAREAVEPFAKAAMGVETFDPDFPAGGAALRSSFDWYDMAQDDPLKRHSVRRRDLDRARATLAAISDKLGRG